MRRQRQASSLERYAYAPREAEMEQRSCMFEQKSTLWYPLNSKKKFDAPRFGAEAAVQILKYDTVCQRETESKTERETEREK